MSGESVRTFWDVTVVEWRLQIEGYYRRRLYALQDLAQHYIWIKSLISNKGAKRVEQLVRDPRDNMIFSSDYDDPEEFRKVIEARAKGLTRE